MNNPCLLHSVGTINIFLLYFLISDISSSTSPVRQNSSETVLPQSTEAAVTSSSSPANLHGGSPLKIGNVLSNQQALIKLQPHQGSNPCQERNLCPPGTGQLSVTEGDGLIQRSSKDRPLPRARRDSEEFAAESAAAAAATRVRSPHTAAPIPYLQNDFSALDAAIGSGSHVTASSKASHAAAKNKKNQRHAKQTGKRKQSSGGASVHIVPFEDLSKSNLQRARDLQAAVSQPLLRVRNQEALMLGVGINQQNHRRNETGRVSAEDQSLSI